MARLILCLVASLVAAYAWVAIAAARTDAAAGLFAAPAALPVEKPAGGVAWSRRPMLP